ncbi:MAG: D-glucuronyl C5-epimerase family protein [Solirubrobacterales bacterium]
MDFLTPSSRRAAGVAVRSRSAPFAVLSVVVGLFAALPVTAASGASVSSSISQLEQSGSIDAAKAAAARRAYIDARIVRRQTSGSRRRAISFQIRIAEGLARGNRLTADRVTPVFTTLQNNADWFASNGPATAGTDRRFGRSRIIFQYFAGQGWQFHPLSNFAKLNAVWTVKSKPARRALGKYAHELLGWAVNRGGALTWEYYFPFSGSRAPFVSSISQGTAVQSLARAGNALSDPVITAAAKQATQSFEVPAPVGLRLSAEEGYHYIGYSGNRRLRILNMFLQSLDGLHDYSTITDDQNAWNLYREGLKAARRETAASDTGAWSLYSVGGAESSLHYHQLVTTFLSKLCGETSEEIFCRTRTNFDQYTKQPPQITAVTARVRGRRVKVSFKLSKMSYVAVMAIKRGTSKNVGSAKALVGYGSRRFGFKKPKKGIYRVKVVATDLAGNRNSATIAVRVK